VGATGNPWGDVAVGVEGVSERRALPREKVLPLGHRARMRPTRSWADDSQAVCNGCGEIKFSNSMKFTAKAMFCVPCFWLKLEEGKAK